MDAMGEAAGLAPGGTGVDTMVPPRVRVAGINGALSGGLFGLIFAGGHPIVWLIVGLVLGGALGAAAGQIMPRFEPQPIRMAAGAALRRFGWSHRWRRPAGQPVAGVAIDADGRVDRRPRCPRRSPGLASSSRSDAAGGGRGGDRLDDRHARLAVAGLRNPGRGHHGIGRARRGRRRVRRAAHE